MDDQLTQDIVTAAPEEVTELLNDLRAAVAQVRDELRATRDELRATNERAAAHERIIERLHDENQRLRAGERQLVLRPVLVDLHRLRNELLREAAAAGSDSAPGQLLISFAHSVEQALERGGVLIVRPAVDDAFDPGQHRAVDVVPAEEGEDATVAGVVSDGYRDVVADRMLAPAAVVVRRQPPVQAAARAAEPPDPPVAG